MAADGRALSQTARALLDDFQVDAGVLRLRDEQHARWMERLEGWDAARAEALATELIALAIRFGESGEPGAQQGFMQLCELAVVAIERTGDRLEGHPQAAALLGEARSTIPVGQRPAPEGSVGLQDLLFKR